MMETKIALITNFCTHYNYKLFKLLSEKYNFNIYFFDKKEKTKEDIHHLSIFKNISQFNYLTPKEIAKVLLKRKYDVIIKSMLKKELFFTTFIIAKLTKAKFIVWQSIWYHPLTLQYKFFSWLLIKILKDYVDAIVVYGEHAKRFLIEKGINSDKIFIAWWAVDNELYGRDISEDEVKNIRLKFGIKKDEKIILYVGRLERLKGLEYLIEALRILKDKGLQFLFLCIGDGNMKKEIEELCIENKIKFVFTGILPPKELPHFYKISTLLILPSITTKTFKEPWGLVVNEAFHQGCPVVVTDAVGAGVGGLVKNGVNGFVVPERNSEALVDAILKILTNPELREFFSQNALEEIKQWTYERQAKGFLDSVEYSLKRT